MAVVVVFDAQMSEQASDFARMHSYIKTTYPTAVLSCKLKQVTLRKFYLK